MILFDNSLIKLEYVPATDILEVAYPDLHEYLLGDIEHSIDVLVETITNYDVKRVLLDSSGTVVAVGVEHSRRITTYLVSGLARTRLQRLARLQSTDYTVESTAEGNIRYVREALALPFQLQNFSSKPAAVAWLTGSNF